MKVLAIVSVVLCVCAWVYLTYRENSNKYVTALVEWVAGIFKR
jgi:hypothetical protein